jgi:hypothetical protein|tara:strand:- start:167 stop:1129 length:963 start_codon:yes stop_codon:yes gene_type:complete
MRPRYIFSSRRTRKIDPHNKHKTPYPKLAAEVVTLSDIIIQVLDARFLDETRNLEIEKLARELGKPIICVINKVDLVDQKKLATSKKLTTLKPYVFTSCKERIGKRDLIQRIKIMQKNLPEKEEKSETFQKKKHSAHKESNEPNTLYKVKINKGKTKLLKISNKIHLGIIGYPNVGKSSVINFITGGSAKAKTSKEAGHTKGIQKVKLNSQITILDTPGIIKHDDNPNKTLQHHATIGARSHDNVKDPELSVAFILKTHPRALEDFYSVPKTEDVEELLEAVGSKLKILKKGNVVDMDKVARKILKDWQLGKIIPEEQLN